MSWLYLASAIAAGTAFGKLAASEVALAIGRWRQRRENRAYQRQRDRAAFDAEQERLRKEGKLHLVRERADA